MIALQAIYSLSTLYVSLYNKERFRGKPMNYLLHIIDSVVSKKVMLVVYNDLVKDSWLIPIDNLETYDKQQLVNECRSTGLKFTNSSLTDAARILHTLKFINANS